MKIVKSLLNAANVEQDIQSALIRGAVSTVRKVVKLAQIVLPVLAVRLDTISLTLVVVLSAHKIAMSALILRVVLFVALDSKAMRVV